MRRFLMPLVLLASVLAVPIVPFVVWGELDANLTRWIDAETPPQRIAYLVLGVLASDIFLPIPSSAVNTFAGYRLGAWHGTLVCWLGLTFGALLGFGLARVLGRPFARWFSNDAELERMQALSERYGPFVLVLARAVPVMAEASVLLMGALRLSWWRFLPAVTASNLGIAVAYAVLGDVASQYEAVPFALAVSIALPVLVATILNRFVFPRGAAPVKPDESRTDQP